MKDFVPQRTESGLFRESRCPKFNRRGLIRPNKLIGTINSVEFGVDCLATIGIHAKK